MSSCDGAASVVRLSVGSRALALADPYCHIAWNSVGSRALSFSGPLLSVEVEFCLFVGVFVCLFVRNFEVIYLENQRC